MSEPFQLTSPSATTRGALFSPCRQYRYLLWRTWDASKPALCFIMLNPSTADAENNDPTVERCQRRAVTSGFGAVHVLNVFAFRTTDPEDMKKESDPVGPENDGYIARAAASAKANGAQLVAAWGHHAQFMDREKHVLKIFRHFDVDLYCLGVTMAGYPRHPLYVGYETKPVIFKGK